jgi:hypothetical protein
MSERERARRASTILINIAKTVAILNRIFETIESRQVVGLPTEAQYNEAIRLEAMINHWRSNLR